MVNVISYSLTQSFALFWFYFRDKNHESVNPVLEVGLDSDFKAKSCFLESISYHFQITFIENRSLSFGEISHSPLSPFCSLYPQLYIGGGGKKTVYLYVLPFSFWQMVGVSAACCLYSNLNKKTVVRLF